MIDQKTYYDKKADTFENGLFLKRSNRNHLKKIKKICELLNLNDLSRPNSSILEVGVGTGIHAKYLLMQYPDIRYTGIDISKGMINKAKKKLSEVNKVNNITLLVANGERLPYKNNSFDAAYISGSLHHFANPRLGLIELVRVVRRGIVIMEPNWLFPTNFFAGCTKKVERNILKMSKRNFRKWASDSDIDNTKINNFIYTPPVLMKILVFVKNKTFMLNCVTYLNFSKKIMSHLMLL